MLSAVSNRFGCWIVYRTKLIHAELSALNWQKLSTLNRLALNWPTLGVLVLVVMARADGLIAGYPSVVEFLERKEGVVGRGVGTFGGNTPI